MGISNFDVVAANYMLNNRTGKYTTGTTTTTFAAGQLTGGNFVVYNNTQATPGSIATRTAALMIGDIAALFTDVSTDEATKKLVGTSYILRIINGQGTGTLTVTAGTSVTLTGTMTVAINTFRDFLVTIDTVSTMTFQSIGTGTNS